MVWEEPNRLFSNKEASIEVVTFLLVLLVGDKVVVAGDEDGFVVATDDDDTTAYVVGVTKVLVEVKSPITTVVYWVKTDVQYEVQYDVEYIVTN